MEETINQRVKKARLRLNLSQEDVAEAINKKVSAISKIESGSQNVTPELMTFYYRKGVDAEWILDGTDQEVEFRTELEKSYTNMQVYNNGRDRTVDNQQIPLYNLMAAAGLVTLFNSNQYILDYISIPNLPKCDGAVYVAGDSMYPLLKSGDIVIFRKVSDMQDGIFYGEMHVVEYLMSDDYITTVKFVQKAEQEGYIKLVSENRHHQPKEIPLSKVRALAVVKASIRINAMV